MNERFRHFVAIDWSGAVGPRQPGIAVAICAAGTDAPQLLRPGAVWSRRDVLDWLRDDLPKDSLVGLDLGISLPFADCGAFFPGWRESPADARSLWKLVDDLCASDPHLAANSFVDHAEASRHFRRHGGREGDRFGTGGKRGGPGRFRVTEHFQQKLGCKPYSNFNLVGAAQVGKASLTGMRMLHRLTGALPVWPVDPLPASGSVIVEIYTALAAIAAGRSASRSKIRTSCDLADALATLGCKGAAAPMASMDDHQADALIASAWLRTAASLPQLWRPQALTPDLARTEGWTFGAS